MAERELALKITIDDGGAASTVERLTTSLKGNETAAQMAAEADKRLDAASKELDKSVDGLEKKVAKLGQAHDTTRSAVSELESTFLRYASGAAVLGAVNRTLDWADGLNDLSARAGTSVESMQRLDYIARQFGGTGESMTRMITTLTERLGSGDTAAVGAVTRLGLSMDALKESSPDVALEAINAKLREMPDLYQQSATAQDLFGRSGKENLPALTADWDELGQKARETGQILDTEMVKSLADANDAIDNATRAGTVLLGSFLGPMAPMATEAATAMASLSQAIRTMPTLPDWMSQRFGVGSSQLNGRVAQMAFGAVTGAPGLVQGATGAWDDIYGDSANPKIAGRPNTDYLFGGRSRLVSGGAATAIPPPGSVNFGRPAGRMAGPGPSLSPYDQALGADFMRSQIDANGVAYPSQVGDDTLNQWLGEIDAGNAEANGLAGTQRWFDELQATMAAVSAESDAAQAGVSAVNAVASQGVETWKSYRAAAQSALKLALPRSFNFGADTFEQTMAGENAGSIGLNFSSASDFRKMADAAGVAQRERLSGVPIESRKVTTSQDGERYGNWTINVDAKGSVFENDAALGTLADRVARRIATQTKVGTRVGA